jgi:class 3 adenylate cyclase
MLDAVVVAMVAAVHRYEGAVNQTMGDGIMALFGAPIAHEDHALRAACAALSMQEVAHRARSSNVLATTEPTCPLAASDDVHCGQIHTRS